MTAIEIRNLTKRFGRVTAVNNLSLSIPKNKIFGLLGSNGAGKTTVINILTGLLRPDSGSIKILGMDNIKDIEEIRKNISLVPQTISLYENLTVYENLEFFGGLYTRDNNKLKKEIESLLDVFNLRDKKKTKVSNLSGGYQRRCSIACSIISSPKILFLDEPLTGIDLHTSKFILNFIKSIEDVTIIFTTHSIKEAQAICDHIVFMDAGKKILEGEPKEIIKEFSKKIGERVVIDFDHDVDIQKVLSIIKKSDFNITNLDSNGNSISFFTSDIGDGVVNVLSLLGSFKSHIKNIDITKPTLEDVFDKLMENKK